jgi:hypothetical protein
VKTCVLSLILCMAAAAGSARAEEPAPPDAPAPAPQPAPSDNPPTGAPQDALSEARAACATDIQALCAGVEPGGGRILACLKQHKAQVSEPCRQAVVRALKRPG